MNNHPLSTITDFRYLNVSRLPDRIQIECGLANLGTDPEVIFWFFTQFDDLKAEYKRELAYHRDNGQ